MPLFTYTCERERCDYSGEHLVKNSEEVIYCPKCEHKLVRQMSRPSIQKSGLEGSAEPNASGEGNSLNCGVKSISARVCEHGVPHIDVEYNCGSKAQFDVGVISKKKLLESLGN